MSPTTTQDNAPVPALAYETLSANLKRESERLKTFQNWPVGFIDSKKLTQNGFYYTGKRDSVRCVFCGVEIGFWEEGDDPQKDHAEWSRTCPFLNGRACGNIPLSEDATPDNEAIYENSHDICGPYGSIVLPFSGPERSVTALATVNTSTLWKDLEQLGISKTSGPVSPQYSTLESRLRTYDTWPGTHPLSPQRLAEAGFYYTSIHDETVCFHCGGGLKCWEKDDDPFVEHARCFSECGFINIHKGRDFVNEVCSKKKAILTVKAVQELSESKPENNPTEEPAATEASTSGPSSSCSSGISSMSQLELCVICCSRERAIVFLPCGHFVSCVNCAPSLSTCALCRMPYHATVRAYLS